MRGRCRNNMSIYNYLGGPLAKKQPLINILKLKQAKVLQENLVDYVFFMIGYISIS